MATSAHSIPLEATLPHVLEIDQTAWLRQVEPTDVFQPFDRSIGRYITWAALSIRNPRRQPIDVLTEYCLHTLRGRYMIVAEGQQAGYLGISRGTKRDVAGVAYFVSPAARGKNLASRALRAVTQLEVPEITAWELTIADSNKASIKVAEECGFLATDAYINDGVLRLKERIFRKEIGI